MPCTITVAATLAVGAAPVVAAAAVTVAGVAVAATAAQGAAVVYEAVTDAWKANMDEPYAAAFSNPSSFQERTLDLPDLVAAPLLRGSQLPSTRWEQRVRLATGPGQTTQLDGALFSSSGRFLFGLRRSGAGLVATIQGGRGQEALDAAYRQAVLSLTDAEMKRQGFHRIGGDDRGPEPTRVYQRARAGIKELYRVTEQAANGTIRMDALHRHRHDDPDFGIDKPPFTILTRFAPPKGVPRPPGGGHSAGASVRAARETAPASQSIRRPHQRRMQHR